jgi:hypothetical protein
MGVRLSRTYALGISAFVTIGPPQVALGRMSGLMQPSSLAENTW